MKTNNIVIGVLLVVVLFLLCKPCMCNENYSDACNLQCGLMPDGKYKQACYEGCVDTERQNCVNKCDPSLPPQDYNLCKFNCAF